MVTEWTPDVLRHSFCSYRLAETRNIGQVAEEAGNSLTSSNGIIDVPCPTPEQKSILGRPGNLVGEIVDMTDQQSGNTKTG